MQAAAREFPSVASVRVREALATSRRLAAKLALAVRAATGVALTSSAIVLAGALAANRRARLDDATILKILGATRRRLIGDVPDRIRPARPVRRRCSARRRARRPPMRSSSCHGVRFRLRRRSAARRGSRRGLALTVALGMVGAWRILGEKPAAFLREL